ncbi:MAG: twin-arginine translocation signal domain-containing protein, partial [Candidatus Nanosalina sp.]
PDAVEVCDAGIVDGSGGAFGRHLSKGGGQNLMADDSGDPGGYDEEIEQIIERKVQERLDDRVEEEVEKRMEKRAGKPEQKNLEEAKAEMEKTGDGISRRSFLKMLGLGAGGMALSSAAAGAGWSVFQPSTSGVSDIKSSKVADNSITSSKIVDGTIQRNDTAFSPQKTKTIKSSNTTNYTTAGEDKIYVDTSTAAVTVTLASADATQGNEIEIQNISGANPVTVDTEGSETIDPNAAPSKTIGKAGWSVSFVSDGSSWDSSNAAEFESLSTDERSVRNLGAEVFDSTGTSIPDSTFTKIEFDSEVADDFSAYDTSTYEFATPRAGDYEIAGQIQINSSTDGARFITRIMENGSQIARPFSFTTGGANPLIAPFNRTLKDLPSGNSYSIEVFQNSGSSVTTTTGRDLTAATFTYLG